MKKKVISGILAVLMAVQSASAVMAASSYNNNTYFDEWDSENLSSRYARQAEKLNRGVVAVKTADMDHVFISWRLNGYEPENSKFNLYRDGVLITAEPIELTNFKDFDGDVNSKYSVGLVVNSEETECSQPVGVLENQYLEIKLAPHPPVTTLDIVTDGSSETLLDKPATYGANDVHVADLDGDGRYDFLVKLVPSNQNDPMGNYADKTYLDAYTQDGEHLYRIDMGANLRSQRHGIQPLVYDFDGDGKAEIAVMTADGTVSLRPNSSGNGTYGTFGGFDSQPDIYGTLDANYDVISVIGDPREVGKSVQHGKWVQDKDEYYMNQEGPLYLTVFDGLTGEEIDTIPYDPQTSRQGYEIAVNGYSEGAITVDGFTFDGYALPEGAMPINTASEKGAREWGTYPNHPWRNNSAVVYLDGKTPGMVFQRGIYMGRVALAAYTLEKTSDGKRQLVQEWRADTYDSSSEGGQKRFGGIDAQGNHNISVGDLDGSGRDSYIIGASAVKYDGTLLWTTGRGHGDAQHLGKYDPTRKGLQFMSVHERSPFGFSFLDASTGRDIAKRQSADADTGRGIVGIWGDFDGAHAVISASESTGGYTYKGGVGSSDALTKLENIHNLPNVADSETGKATQLANFRIYWDGDLWDEIMDGYDESGTKDRDMEYGIYKYSEDTDKVELLFSTDGAKTIDFTKMPPCAVADIFGDWREEFIARSADDTAIRIYTTVIPTEYRYYTFMHDALYRVSAARQWSGYNQPPHIGFYLADRDGQRDLQPKANIYTANGEGIFIDSHPQKELDVISGEINTKLSVDAKSNPAETELKYQWYETTGTVNEFSRRPVEGTPISGETSRELNLPSDLSVGEHYYYCVVSADGMNDKTSFVSKVNVLASAEIEITKQLPSTVETIVGNIDDRLEIDAKVTPSDEISYQWYSCTDSDGSNAQAIENETGKTFEIPKNLGVGTYYYYCMVSADGAESVMSKITAVKVNYDLYKLYDGNNFTDTNNVWFTNDGGVGSANLKVTVNTAVSDGISGVIDSYANIAGKISGNRSVVSNIKAAPQEALSANKEYFIEYDVRFESTSAGYIDVGIWPENANVGKTNAIARLTMNKNKELYWAVDTQRGASSTENGTKINEFSGTLNQWLHVQLNLNYETMTGTIRITSNEPNKADLEYNAEFLLEKAVDGEKTAVSDSIGQFGTFFQRSATADASVSIANVHFFTVDKAPAVKEGITSAITSDSLKYENGAITGNISVNVANYETDNLSASAILAVYDNEGKLIFTRIKNDVNLAKGDTNAIDFDEINISNADAKSYKYKVFIWDFVASMKALTKVIGADI